MNQLHLWRTSSNGECDPSKRSRALQSAINKNPLASPPVRPRGTWWSGTRWSERGCLCLVSLYLDWILTYLPKKGNYVLLLFFDAPFCWQKIFGYSFYNIFEKTPTWLFRLLRHKEVDLSSSWIHEGIPDESFQTWGNRNKLHRTYLSVLHKASQASKNAHDTTVTVLFTIW